MRLAARPSAAIAAGAVRTDDIGSRSPAIVLAYAYSGATRIADLLSGSPCLACTSGRQDFCSTGDYTERTVPLDAESRRALETVVTIVGDALREGFLPAAPAAGKCAWCDYRAVCGPYEEIRVERKPRERLEPLERLRRLP